VWHRFERLTRSEIGSIAPEATALLTVAATEQHGPHLPVSVDGRVAEHVAQAAAGIAGTEIDVVTCPPLVYGASHHHLAFPGALSLGTETLLRVLHDLGDALVASGFRRIYLLNGHGGNDEVVRLAARELALRHDVLAGAASYWTVAWEALERDGRAFGLGRVPGHAGGFETSLMLAIDPAAVREADLPPHREDLPAPQGDPAARPLVHRHGSWAAIDGYSDDARAADGAAGAALLEMIAKEVATALIRFHRGLDETASATRPDR
jgi:creatinine amidohydrolase